jgi:hypothetical protein
MPTYVHHRLSAELHFPELKVTCFATPANFIATRTACVSQPLVLAEGRLWLSFILYHLLRHSNHELLWHYITAGQMCDIQFLFHILRTRCRLLSSTYHQAEPHSPHRLRKKGKVMVSQHVLNPVPGSVVQWPEAKWQQLPPNMINFYNHFDILPFSVGTSFFNFHLYNNVPQKKVDCQSRRQAPLYSREICPVPCESLHNYTLFTTRAKRFCFAGGRRIVLFCYCSSLPPCPLPSLLWGIIKDHKPSAQNRYWTLPLSAVFMTPTVSGSGLLGWLLFSEDTESE